MAARPRFPKNVAPIRVVGRVLAVAVCALALLVASLQVSHAHSILATGLPEAAVAAGTDSEPCDSGQPHEHGVRCVHAAGHPMSGIVASNAAPRPHGDPVAFPADRCSLRGTITLPGLRPPTLAVHA